jgi:hypothetical protein
MRSLKYGLAAVIVLAMAMPAMARSWVVCVDTTKDVNPSSETCPAASTQPLFFSAAAPIYPAGTDVSTATDCTPATLKATVVGTFFAMGSCVIGLPQSVPPDNDVFEVLWHFRINGDHGGNFDTTGPVRSTPTYAQTIIGSTNPGLVPTHGKAVVTTLTTGAATVLAFKIKTP